VSITRVTGVFIQNLSNIAHASIFIMNSFRHNLFNPRISLCYNSLMNIQ